MSVKFSTIRGTRDIFGPDVQVMRFIEESAKHVFSLFSYAEIRTPIFEETGLFVRSIGESTDIVEKEMYTFKDKKGRSLTLRPEGTAPVVRAYLQAHLNKKEKITRLFYTGQMFRYERPQAGRSREFWQIGAEVFGVEAPLADAEIILLNTMILNRIGINTFTLHINSVGCSTCREKFKQALISFAKLRKSKLCENCQKRLETNPLRILDCKKNECRESLKSAPKITDYLDEKCRTNLDQVLHMVQGSGIPKDIIVLDPSIVRGLDYYTGVVFEIKSSKLGAQDAISAGGRYDTLVQEMGGPSIPAVGFAIGIDRLISLIPGNVIEHKKCIKIFISTMNEEARKKGFYLAQKLREQGMSVELEMQNRSLKAQLSYAADKGFSPVVIIGEDELSKGCFTLKDMSRKTQTSLPSVESLIAEINVYEE